MTRSMKVSLAALAFVAAAGCTQERAPRSFVQPNVIKKADLAGTWYYLQTVTDAPPTHSAMFIGLSSELMKIKFDVQENMIFARRAYEHVKGTEDAYQQDPAKYAGMPIAAWPIASQFDIIRDYNSTTGEETNRIIESTERPWNEREFIRVNWSDSQIVDAQGLGLNFFFEEGLRVQNASYWESDPTKPDALHMERADETDPEFAKDEANYLDITNKWVLTPEMKNFCFSDGCFSFPVCLINDLNDCASSIVKVKHAFAKISPKHDYEPRKWDGKQMDMFGIWDVGLNRLTYNRQYGVTNSGFKRHAARFNLWEKSYQEDGKTPIAFADRTQRTIPYYAESSLEPFPPELFSIGKDIISQWNEAVKVAVKDVTGKPAAKEVFVWCHNPVKLVADSMGEADPEACKGNLKPERDAKGQLVKDDNGNPIYRARQGDPRRSTIFWVNQQQNGGPLGYGPPLFDIETGETISGQAYIYGGAVDSYSARSRDLVLLVSGKLNSDDFVNGVNVKEWVDANLYGKKEQPTFNQTDVSDRAKAMDFGWAKDLAPEARLDKSNLKNFIESLKVRRQAIFNTGRFGTGSVADMAQIRRDRLRGTPLEALMINSDVFSMSGDPTADWNSLSEEEKLRVSPLRSYAVRKAEKERLDKMTALGVDFADFADEGIAQAAIKMAQDPNIQDMDPEAIRQAIRREVFLGVTLHEVGHNMGLRHNFRASFDAINYFPEYWELRSAGANEAMNGRFAGVNNGSVQAKAYGGRDPNAANKGCVKGQLSPRYVDCPGGATSAAEVEGAVRQYQYSSIMDYGAEFNSDFQGLGHYDKAAMKFSYAGQGYVEVFTKAKPIDLKNFNDQISHKWASLLYFQGAFGFPGAIDVFGGNIKGIHYTTYPSLFEDNDPANLQEREDVPFDETQNIEDLFRLDVQGRPVVPYYFCSDEFVGNLTCQRFDSGADAYEQATDLISRYENFYLLNNFKRDRYPFRTSWGYYSRIAGRYLDMLREQMTWYTLLRADFEGDVDANFFDSEQDWGNFTVAVSEGFDLLGRIITMPDVTKYEKVLAGGNSDAPITYYKKAGYNAQNTVSVGILDGKYTDTAWDQDGCGYYWADECQTRIGYFIDKTIALDVLSQSQAYFTGRDTSTDVRRYAIGYYTAFKSQVSEKLGALLGGDFTSLAPYIENDATPSKAVLKKKSWALSTPTPGGATPIDPAGGFTLQLYAGLYAMASFPGTYDNDFIETTKVFIVGNGEAPVKDALLIKDNGQVGDLATTNPSELVGNGGAKEWFVWTDPTTGKTYAARSFPTRSITLSSGTRTMRVDTGVRVLETMKTLSEGSTQQKAAAAKYRANIEVLRSLHKAFGYATFNVDTPFYF